MSSIIPDEGLNWVADRAIPGVDEPLQYIDVGDGTSFPEAGDSSLESRVYRANVDNSNCTIERSSNRGQINASITITGGTHVDPGTEITELGLLTDDDRLVYRETRAGIEIDEGERVTISFGVVVER